MTPRAGPVAVTGATGHLGANLVRELLAQGRRVRAVVPRPGPALDGLDVEIVRADVLDRAAIRVALEGASAVHHLAGVITIDGDPDGRTYRTNVDGTRNVAAAALAAGLQRMVHYSSVHAFDLEQRGRPLDETSPRPGAGHPVYDRSKAAGEDALRRAIDQGLDAVIVNPTAVIGPHDFAPSRTGRMLLMLAAGRMPALVDGGFDWVDSRDVVQAALAAEQRGRRGENYVLSGHWRSFADLAGLVHEWGGSPPPRIRSPLWLAGLAAPFAGYCSRLMGREPLFTRGSLRVVRGNPNVSSVKAANELGYKPRSTESTVRDTLDWFAQHGRLAGGDWLRFRASRIT